MKIMAYRQIVIVAVMQSVLFFSVACAEQPRDRSDYIQQPDKANAVVTDQWALKVKPGTDPVWLKNAVGATEINAIGSLKDTYLVTIPDSKNRAATTKNNIKSIDAVQWLQQQTAIQRKKK